MEIDDIKKASAEAEKFIEFCDAFFAADKEKDGYSTPAEIGLVKAQSLILSRQLSAMRNPWTCKRNKRGHGK